MSKITLTAEMKEALEAFEQSYLTKLDDTEKTAIITDLNDILEMFYEAGEDSGDSV